MFRKIGLFLICGLLAAPTVFADPDLPGASATVEAIPIGSLIIPMDTVHQLANDAQPENFNIAAYGLANKLLQNNIPIKWAMRTSKVKIAGATTGANNSTTLIDTTKNFVTLGVQVGDLITNTSKNPMTRSRVTAVAATTLTVSAIDALDFDNGNEYVVDGADFAVAAERIRPSAVASASLTFTSAPFIVSNDNPANVAKALEIMTGVSDGILPVLPQFNANAAQIAVRVYRTTAAANVDIRYNLTHKPFAAVSDVNTDIHSDILVEAGIPGADACAPLPGAPGFNPNACNWNTINPVNLSSIECATIHLEPHRDEEEDDQTPDLLADAVENFVNGGGNFVAQCHSVEYFENNDTSVPPNLAGGGRFMTSNGAADNGANGSQQYPNAPMAFNQMTGPLNGGQGGSIPRWTLNGGTYNKNSAFINSQNQAAPTTHRSASAKVATGGGIGGMVFYLGGHEYTGTALENINGRRMVLNALFVPPDRPQNCGLTVNATLIIRKRVINDGGGTLGANDFGITTSAGSLTFDGGVADGANTTLYTADELTVLAADAFTLTENNVANYTEGTWTCTSELGDNTGGGAFGGGSVTLQPGDTKTCTITNNDAIPNINLSKTVFSGPTYDSNTQRFTVVYRVTASNTGQGASTYNIVDTFSPAPGISLFSANWSYAPGGESQTGTLGAGFPTIANGGTVVSNEGLAGGASETWSVTAEFSVVPGSFTGAEDDCVQQSEVTGTGFYNSVAVSGPNDTATDNDACVNLPPPSINLAKTVFSGPTFNGGTGRYTVTYRISATNSGQGPGLYSLVDTFSPAAGISLFSTSWSYAPGGETQTGTLGGGFPVIANGGTVVTNEVLVAGASETWSVTAEFTVNPGALTGAEDDCVQQSEVAGNGFYNAVAVSGANDTLADNDACVNLPPPAINLAKTVFSGPTFSGGTGRYTVVYRVSANNTGQGPGIYNIVDTFSPAAGISLFSASWAYTSGGSQTGTLGGAFPAIANGGTVVTGEGLASGASEVWSVTAEFTVNPNDFTGQEDDCVAGQETTNSGFYNAVAVSGSSDAPEDNDACVNLPAAGINLQKTVSSGPTFNSGTGRYTVVYSISADNTGGGPGTYDIQDTFSPAPGITLFSTAWAYGGGETETGTKHGSYPNAVPNGAIVVDDEILAAGAGESWTVTAEFTINPALLTGAEDDCVQGQESSGTGFYNFVDGNIQEDETDNDACVNLPPAAINLSKAVTSGPTFSAGTGRYTVVYTITADNTTGQGPGIYDLTDTFSPATGITLFSTAWAYGGGETETGTKHASYPNAVPNGALVVDNEGLVSGDSETWVVTAEFTVNPGALTGTEDDCVQGQEQAGEGFYNAVSVSGSSDEPTDNDACVNLPSPNINLAKTVTSGPTYNLGTGRYTVVYQIAANNTGDGPGVYDLTDTFSPATGITLFSTAWAYGGGETETGTKHASYPNAVPNGALVVDNEGLISGESETWTVTAQFTVDPGALNGTEDGCVQGQEQASTGFYNAVSASGSNDVPGDNDACVNLPDPSLDLAKTIVGEPLELGPDQWQVTYLITATNTGDGPAVFDVMDTLDPGDGIVPVLPPTVTYVAISDTFTSPVSNPAGWPLISDNETLAGQTSESWQVVVAFDLDREATSFQDELLCSEVQGVFTPGRGFYNAVDLVDGETNTSNNDACATPRVIFVEAVAECIADAPWVTYTVTHSGFNPAPTGATISWINRDGITDTVVSGPFAAQPLSGQVLWPDAAVDPGGNATVEPGDQGVAWPGWTEAPPGTWTFDMNSDLVPTLVFKVEVNPEDEAFVFYPPALPTCNAGPPAINTIEKQITNVLDNGDDTFDITYLITVTNTGGQPEIYDLVDTLQVDESLTLLSVVTPVTYVPGTDSQDGTLENPGVGEFNSGNTAIVTGEDLNAGTSEGYTFTLRFELEPDDWTEEGGNCDTSDDTDTGTGFANNALLYVDEQLVDQDDACEPIPEPEEAVVTVAKDVTDVVDNGDGTFDVSYRITVTNTGNQSADYDLSDSLVEFDQLIPTLVVSPLAYLPGDDVQTGTLGTPDVDAFISGEVAVVTGESLAATSDESFVFTLRFELDPEQWTAEGANCTLEEGETGTGFTNHVELLVGREVVDEDDACAPVPRAPETDARATFTVQKEFVDGNSNTDVTYRIDCNTGLILDQVKTTHVNEGPLLSAEDFEVEFVVTDFDQGELTCEVWEDPVVPGYTPSYDCDSNTLATCDSGAASDLDDYYQGPCVFSNVDTTEIGEDAWQHLCMIRNYPNPVPVVVNKAWVLEGSGGDYIDPYYQLTLTCENEITTEGAVYNGYGSWSITFTNSSGTSDAQYTAWVIPDWNGGTSCEVHESLQDQAVEIDNDCSNLLAQLGDGDECTITNTVFFEGIPTLNPYGIMLLALLMLGMGFVGFRRFS